MTPERGEQVRDLFVELVEASPTEREALLAHRCGDDPELRTLVEIYLESHEQAIRKRFLPEPPRTSARIRCPHCRNPIEVVGLVPIEDVLCPSCGSSFRLEPTTSTATSPKLMARRFGRFDLLERVGVGTFGTVFKAYDPRLDRPVALKVLRAGELASLGERERFLREPRNAAQLSHPGIVPVHDVSEHEDTPFIISEFVDGLTLSALLKARRPTPREAARLVAQLADALHYAHEHGVIHRDVKPSNVMIDESGEPHLMDFGLAKREAGEITITLDGQVLGTPAYMSPEQARGESAQVDRRSDVYSLGVILYEMLTGELPFRGNTRMLLQQVLNDDPRPPRLVNDSIPRDMETVCLCAMAKEPPRRYASALALANDLRRFLNNEPIKARPANLIEHTWRWAQRNALAAGAIMATALSLVTATVLSVLFAIHRHQMLIDSRRHLAQADFDLGREACERGDLARGLHLLHRSARAASEANDPDWTRVAQAGLAAWSSEFPPVRGVYSHGTGVNSVAISPDGQTVLTASSDRTAQLWNIDTSSPIGDPLRHDDHVWVALFSPDGRLALTAGLDGAVRLWDAATGQPHGPPLRHDGSVWSAVFSRDGTTVLSGGDDKKGRIWDVASGAPLGVLEGHTKRITSVALSPDGKTALTGSSDRTARLWNIATRQPIGEPLQHDEGQGVGEEMMAVAFSPQGEVAATTSHDGTARLWSARTGLPLHEPLRHVGRVFSPVFSPDGQTLLTTCADRKARLWDVATGKLRCAPLEHADRVWVGAFSPDGKTVATGGWDRAARLWDAVTGKPLGRPFRHEGWIRNVVFSPDGRRLLTASEDGTAHLWEITSQSDRSTTVTLSEMATVAAYSADGQQLLIGTHQGRVYIVDAGNGAVRGEPLDLGEPLSVVGSDPDGTVLLAGGKNGRVQLWWRATGKPLGQPVELGDLANSFAFSPDRKHVACSSVNGTARLFDIGGRQHWSEPLTHEDGIFAVAFSRDSQILCTASADRTVRLWDTATGRQRVHALDHPDKVTSLAVSPDGKTLVSGCLDGYARFWSLRSGKEQGEPLNHLGGVFALSYRSDGQLLATGGSDGVVRIWNTSTRTQMTVPLQHANPIETVEFSRDSELLLTSTLHGEVGVWDVTLGRPIGPWLVHPAETTSVTFNHDGTQVLTCCRDNLTRVWKITRPNRRLEALPTEIEVRTGFEMSEEGSMNSLDSPTWLARKRTWEQHAGARAVP
jgi:WD40 repeat protein/tRNA A-37 threonylcarbamoyl transferase component Bud32